MPLEAATYWKLVCDRCGPEGFAGDTTTYTVAESEKEARELVEDHGGRVEPSGVVICCTCIEEATSPASTGGGDVANWPSETVELTKGELWELRAFALAGGAEDHPAAHFINSALSKCNAALDGTTEKPATPEHSKGGLEVARPCACHLVPDEYKCAGCTFVPPERYAPQPNQGPDQPKERRS
jgi:hypothetical protein